MCKECTNAGARIEQRQAFRVTLTTLLVHQDGKAHLATVYNGHPASRTHHDGSWARSDLKVSEGLVIMGGASHRSMANSSKPMSTTSQPGQEAHTTFCHYSAILDHLFLEQRQLYGTTAALQCHKQLKSSQSDRHTQPSNHTDSCQSHTSTSLP